MTAKSSDDLAISLLTLVIGVGNALLGAYVWLSMWRWFTVPLGAPSIGYAHAFGLSMLVSYASKNPNAKKETDDGLAIAANSLAWTMMAWGIAAVAHAWM